jgi:hypothetical protein
MPKKIHGLSETAEGAAWYAMLQRCYVDRPQYKLYKIKNIQVCQRWRESFVNFFQDMGPKPDPTYSLERLNNDGPYEKSNCIWAPRSRQQRNRGRFNKTVIYQGQEYLLCDLALLCGVNQKLLRMRIFVLGWPVEQAIINESFKRGCQLKKYA